MGLFKNNTAGRVHLHKMSDHFETDDFAEKLLSFVFRDKPDIEVGCENFGISCHDSPLSLPKDKSSIINGRFITASILVQELLIPASKIDMILRMRIKERLQSTERKTISAKEKKELKEDVTSELVSETKPTIKVLDLIVDCKKQLLIIAGTGETLLEKAALFIEQSMKITLPYKAPEIGQIEVNEILRTLVENSFAVGKYEMGNGLDFQLEGMDDEKINLKNCIVPHGEEYQKAREVGRTLCKGSFSIGPIGSDEDEHIAKFTIGLDIHALRSVSLPKQKLPDPMTRIISKCCMIFELFEAYHEKTGHAFDLASV